MDSLLFKEGLIENNLEKIKKVPKVDLHNHIGRGMRFETLNAYLDGKLKKAPRHLDGIEALNTYTREERDPLLKHIPYFREILWDMTLQDAIEDGVTVLEASFGIGDCLLYPNMDAFLTVVENLVQKYKGQINFKPELAFTTFSETSQLDNTFIPLLESNLFQSIDLFGSESKIDFNSLRNYYQYAKRNGIKCKIHLGEFNGEHLIKQAIEVLEIDELQHGIRCVHNKEVIKLILEKNVRLNICPTSNSSLGAISNFANHPIKTLVEEGVNVTINTDDLLMLHSTVSQEYLKLYQHSILTESQLDTIRKNSLTDVL